MLFQLDKKEKEALRAMWNHYSHSGTMPSIRTLMEYMGYKSPRSISIILENLVNKGMIEKGLGGKYSIKPDSYPVDKDANATTIDIPLLGTVACGIPLYAEENIEAMVPVSTKLVKSSQDYFFLRAYGDSMNSKGINDGDLVLVKKQQTANTGDLVVALVDNEATIKELIINTDNVVLKPHSTNNMHSPIILTTDFRVQGVVKSVIKL